MDLMSFFFNLWFAIVGAVLSIYLGKLLKQNGKVLEKMDEGFKMIARLTVEESERTRRTILEELSKVQPGGTP